MLHFRQHEIMRDDVSGSMSRLVSRDKTWFCHKCDCTSVTVASYLSLLVELVDEGAADGAWPDHAKADGELGQVEAAMHCPERSHAVALVYQHRDVVF